MLFGKRGEAVGEHFWFDRLLAQDFEELCDSFRLEATVGWDDRRQSRPLATRR